MGPGSLKAKLKGSMGQNLSMTYFDDYWTECHDSKAIWISFGPRCLLSQSFPQGGFKRSHVAEILFGIRYMSANSRLISPFMIYNRPHGDVQH